MSNSNKSAIIMFADRTHKPIVPKNGKTFELKEAQDVVGGLIEVVDLKYNAILIVNEEGKINGLPINEPATIVAKALKGIGAGDYIVGDVILCPSEMLP